MKEQVFTGEIMHTFRFHNYWAYKIPDEPISLNKRAATYLLAKPCDIVLSVPRVVGSILVETKQIRKWQAFGLSDMRPSQIKALTENEEKGFQSFVFLNVRIKRTAKDKPENRMIVFRWGPMHERLKESSIKAAELKELPYTKSRSVPVNKYRSEKGIYDLSLFHGMLFEEDINEETFG